MCEPLNDCRHIEMETRLLALLLFLSHSFTFFFLLFFCFLAPLAFPLSGPLNTIEAFRLVGQKACHSVAGFQVSISEFQPSLEHAVLSTRHLLPLRVTLPNCHRGETRFLAISRAMISLLPSVSLRASLRLFPAPPESQKTEL